MNIDIIKSWNVQVPTWIYKMSDEFKCKLNEFTKSKKYAKIWKMQGKQQSICIYK